MPESFQETVYDEIQKLKRNLEYKADEINRKNWMIEEKNNQIKELQERNTSLYELNNSLERELNSFKRLIGNIYKKK